MKMALEIIWGKWRNNSNYGQRFSVNGLAKHTYIEFSGKTSSVASGGRKLYNLYLTNNHGTAVTGIAAGTLVQVRQWVLPQRQTYS